MLYLLDGYNLLFSEDRETDTLQERRQALLANLNHSTLAAEQDVWVIFDAHFQPGPGERSRYGNLRVLFTDEAVDADDQIIELLEEQTDDLSNITVVTGDRLLRRRCHRMGTHVQHPHHFFSQLKQKNRKQAKPRKKPKTLESFKNKEIQRWEMLFLEKLNKKKKK